MNHGTAEELLGIDADVVVRPGGFTVGRETLADELMRLAGLDNAVAELDRWGSLSIEALLTAEPDVIVLACAGVRRRCTGSARRRAGRKPRPVSPAQGHGLVGRLCRGGAARRRRFARPDTRGTPLLTDADRRVAVPWEMLG